MGAGVRRWESRLDVDDVRHTVELAGWRFAQLDTIAVETRPELLLGVGEALAFPDHYGRNLDALHDCLRDLPTRTVLLWEGWGTPARAVPSAFRGVIRVLSDRAESDTVPLQVLLRGPGPEEPGIAVLD